MSKKIVSLFFTFALLILQATMTSPVLASTDPFSAYPDLQQIIASGHHVYYVDPLNGSDSNKGDSYAPLKTLSDAVKIANNGDGIFLLSGTYNETDLIGNKDLQANFEINKTLVIAGENIDNTVLSVDNSNTLSSGKHNEFMLLNAPGITLENVTLNVRPLSPYESLFQTSKNSTNDILKNDVILADSVVPMKSLFNLDNSQIKVEKCTFKTSNINALLSGDKTSGILFLQDLFANFADLNHIGVTNNKTLINPNFLIFEDYDHNNLHIKPEYQKDYPVGAYMNVPVKVLSSNLYPSITGTISSSIAQKNDTLQINAQVENGTGIVKDPYGKIITLDSSGKGQYVVPNNVKDGDILTLSFYTVNNDYPNGLLGNSVNITINNALHLQQANQLLKDIKSYTSASTTTAPAKGIPSGTIIFINGQVNEQTNEQADGQAMSFSYALNPYNKNEVITDIGQSTSIYIKQLDGTLMDYSTGKTVSASSLPIVRYEDDSSSIKYYASHDGSQVPTITYEDMTRPATTVIINLNPIKTTPNIYDFNVTLDINGTDQPVILQGIDLISQSTTYGNTYMLHLPSLPINEPLENVYYSIEYQGQTIVTDVHSLRME